MGNALTAVLDVASKTLRWEFYPQACRQSKDNIAYNWSKDHLGSVREMTTQDQMSVSKIGFEYDLWGARSTTTLLANEVPPVGFTGMLLHEKSGLCLARYRVYDPSTGRWLSQDPIGEMDFIAGLRRKIRKIEDVMQVMAYHDDADAFRLELTNKVADHLSFMWPKRRSRLVHDDDSGVELQGAGDG